MRPTRRPLTSAVAAVVLFVAATVVAWVRLPDTARRTLWAEDGRVFLHDRLELGVGGSLFHVYQGYLQFMPRLLTDIAVAVAPLSQFAVVLTALVALTTGAVAAGVFVFSRDAVSSVSARVALAAVTVVTPALTVEVLGTAANVHWLFLWLTPWLLLYRPRARWQAGLVAMLLLVACLTDIQCVFFVPLLLFTVRRSRPLAWPPAAALVVGVAAQLLATVSAPRAPRTEHLVSVSDIVKGYLSTVVLGGLNGNSYATSRFLLTEGWTACLLLAVPFVAAAIVVLVRRPQGWSLVVALAIGAIVPWVAALLLNPGDRTFFSEFTRTDIAHFRLLRYGALPTMFLLATVVVAADRLMAAREPVAWRLPSVDSERRRLIGGLIGVVALLAVVGGSTASFLHFDGRYGLDNRRIAGPTWQSRFTAAQSTCRSGVDSVEVAEAPATWVVELDCAAIASR